MQILMKFPPASLLPKYSGGNGPQGQGGSAPSRRRFKRALIIVTFSTVALILYTQVMMHIASGTPPAPKPAAQQADLILVEKSKRRLTLLKNDQPIAEYTIALGPTPTGHKQYEGDGRTPEGRYEIDWRNANSIAHLSLHISYPNAADAAHANDHDKSPGGDIMIHGILNGWGFVGTLHRFVDWTNGCIAVTNPEMREIWSLVPNGTPIEIKA
jgi:murein L,D-transpeptidase YafK